MTASPPQACRIHIAWQHVHEDEPATLHFLWKQEYAYFSTKTGVFLMSTVAE